MKQHLHARLSAVNVVRYTAISIFFGVGLLVVMFFSRQEFWTWRLTLFGAILGSSAHVFSLVLHVVFRQTLRRARRASARLAKVLIDFVAGCLAFIVADVLTRLAGVAPFSLTSQNYRIAVAISGVLAVFAGLIFALVRRLLRSIERLKEQEFAARELELARSIQKRLLPPEKLCGEGYVITARNLAAHFVAGDYYDVFRMSDGSLGLVVADVSGKGIGASLIVASVKATFPFIAEGRTPDVVLNELNRKLRNDLAAREFVALAYARFHPVAGTLEIANAGLPDPYLLRAGLHPEVISLPGPRFPLAAWRDTSYEMITLELLQGDRILLLTDGLPEAPTPGGDQLGYEGVMALLTSAAAASDLLENLFAMAQSTSTPKLEDDWTALVLHATGMQVAGEHLDRRATA